MMAEKFPKDAVEYGPGDIDGQHCGACTHFIEPSRCEIVYGRIRSGGWCRKFERRAGTDKKEGGDGGVSEKAG